MDGKLTLTTDNVIKAYEEGCSDVKKTLKRLFPQVVFDKPTSLFPLKEVSPSATGSGDADITLDKINRALMKFSGVYGYGNIFMQTDGKGILLYRDGGVDWRIEENGESYWLLVPYRKG